MLLGGCYGVAMVLGVARLGGCYAELVDMVLLCVMTLGGCYVLWRSRWLLGVARCCYGVAMWLLCCYGVARWLLWCC